MTINDKVLRLIRPEIREIAAYHVPDPGDLIKLDAMENPYCWPEAMVDEWLDLLRTTEVNRYPDPAARQLTLHLRAAMDVPENAGLLLGNGSDEIIQMLALALLGPGRVVMAPEPSFVMYHMIAAFSGMEYVGVPLCDDFSLDREAMLNAIVQHDPALIYLAYPNNPTGNLFDDNDVESIIQAANGLVVIDEAYHAFAQKSWMGRLGQYDNLLVMRTVSKLGLAGLRLGLLAGPQQWIDEFDKVRLPYNINVLTQVSAQFALEHIDVLNQQTTLIREEREQLMATLRQMEHVKVFPSKANFILFRITHGAAKQVFDSIKQQGVLIKNMGAVDGPLANCLRVTVGRPEENSAFVAALKNALS